MAKPTVEIYTDGACSNNKGGKGTGGWASLMSHGPYSEIFYGHEDGTSNNRMELQSVINALRSLIVSCRVIIYSDSKYVVNGVNHNLRRWIKDGWRTRNGSPVKNQDLWEQIAELKENHSVKMYWVRGHAGDEANSVADWFAQRAARKPCNKY